MLKIIPIPAFEDNYIWLIYSNGHAAVIDPGDAAPVLSTLKTLNLVLDAILITHHHSDHIDGIQPLHAEYGCPIYAPHHAKYQFDFIDVKENDQVKLANLELNLSVITAPGHTLEHVLYYGSNLLFCGDTLFSAGCGRLFEGSFEQMYASLQKIANLPANTAVYATHEYTQHNLEFAVSVEPDNQELIAYQNKIKSLISQHKPSLPSSIRQELKINPFLRCSSAGIRNKLCLKNNTDLEVFTALRNMRNHY